MPTNEKTITNSYMVADALSKYASDISKSSDFNQKLASVLIYSCLAEFYVDDFIRILINSLETNTATHSVTFNPSSLKNNPNTNLESALKKLRFLKYPKKKEIEKEMEIIKQARNEVFHGLVVAGIKQIRLDIYIYNIRDHVPVLRRLLVHSLVEQLSK